MLEMLMRKSVCGAALVFAAMLPASPAEALTPLTFGTSASYLASQTGGTITAAAPFCVVGPCGSFVASATAGALGGGFVDAIVTESGVPLYGGSIQAFDLVHAGAVVEYGIELTGPAGVMVPITVSSDISTNSDPIYSEQDGTLTVDSALYGRAYTKGCLNAVCQDSSGSVGIEFVSANSTSGPAYLLSDKEYIVKLVVNANLDYNGTVEASIDPTFAVDPAFAGQFHFVGIPAVPEPASWALILTGFGLVGFMLRAGKARTGRVAYS